MPHTPPENVAFARLVQAVEPYLDEIVVVGGWAHRLFTLHPLAQSPGFVPLMTHDADIALPRRLRSKDESIGDLLKKSGFVEELQGDFRPPVASYRLADDTSAFQAEFLIPQDGGNSARDGSLKATMSVAGVTAQRLRHLELLATDPWTVRLCEANGFPLGTRGLDIRIPNAASYLLHKVLVLGDRHGDKRAKDVLYIHDTLMIFAAAFPALRSLASDAMKILPPKTLKKFHRLRHELFTDLSDPIRLAARIALETHRAHPPTPPSLLNICSIGLQEIFST